MLLGALTSAPSQQGEGCEIDPTARFGRGVILGDRVVIGPYAVLYDGVHLGSDSFVGAQVILGEPLVGAYRDRSNYESPPTIIGAGAVLRSGTVIYAGCRMGEGFQTGNQANIREYSSFGARCSVGALSQTDGHLSAGDEVRLHNNVFLSTYTKLGNRVHLYPYAVTVDAPYPPCPDCRRGVVLEDDATIGACSLLLPGVRIGKGAFVGGGAVVSRDVAPGVVVTGSPAQPVRHTYDVVCRHNPECRPFVKYRNAQPPQEPLPQAPGALPRRSSRPAIPPPPRTEARRDEPPHTDGDPRSPHDQEARRRRSSGGASGTAVSAYPPLPAVPPMPPPVERGEPRPPRPNTGPLRVLPPVEEHAPQDHDEDRETPSTETKNTPSPHDKEPQ